MFLALAFTINQALVAMREGPAKNTPVVSEAILSENVTVEKSADGWSYITTPDGYHGWVESSTLTTSSYNPDLKVSRLLAHLYESNDIEYGPLCTLPYGARLQVIQALDSRWIKVALPDGREGFIQKGDVLPEEPLQHKGDLVAFSQRFLGLPYTWGGRSSFGFDCSGFVQMLYAQIGINLQRDARLQILDPRLHPISDEQLEPGDLLFFGKSEQKILHVGLYIGDGQFIHTSARENRPWIRISALTDPEWAGSATSYYCYRTARSATPG